MKYDIKNKCLRGGGRKRIAWAEERMPVLKFIRDKFKRERPFKNVNIACCLHITTETANLATVLKSGGANLRLCASNPLSTQDDVAASLVFDYGVEVFAVKSEDRKTYYQHINRVLEINPQLTLDDGADLVSTIHKNIKYQISKIKNPCLAGGEKNPRQRRVRLRRKISSPKASPPPAETIKNLPWAGTEETTTGVIRLKALERKRKLLYPIIAVNDAYTKHLFDNRYGTGQSTLDGILRATNKLIAGTNFVVCGYGFCGRGIAMRARGHGANVIVAEAQSIRALEAVMDGYRVMPLRSAAKIGDIFVTASGDIGVIGKEHFPLMKNGAVLANAGHFNVEIDLGALERIAIKKREAKPLVTEYTLAGQRAKTKGRTAKTKRIYILGEGRLVNLACAEGHPAEVMDMSFANQALSCEYIVKHRRQLKIKVYGVPEEIDKKVAQLKLKSMGVLVNSLTREQKKYLSSWEVGT